MMTIHATPNSLVVCSTHEPLMLADIFGNPSGEDPTRSFSVGVRLTSGFMITLIIKIFGDDVLGIDVPEEEVSNFVKKREKYLV